jgi:hypothetical protein
MNYAVGMASGGMILHTKFHEARFRSSKVVRQEYIYIYIYTHTHTHTHRDSRVISQAYFYFYRENRLKRYPD